jgi:hypothetical protein
MTVKVRIHEDYMTTLRRALAKPEEVVFAFATFEDGVFEVVGLEIMMGVDVESQSAMHVTLADEVRPRLIKTAWDSGHCLIETHSHGPRGYAEFSLSDLLGFDEWVTHVRWRLRGRPYMALVVAGETWDALAWTDGPEPVTVQAIEITKGEQVIETIAPTNATAASLAAGGRA